MQISSLSDMSLAQVINDQIEQNVKFGHCIIRSEKKNSRFFSLSFQNWASAREVSMSNGDPRVRRPFKRFSAESRTSKQFDRSMRHYEPRKSVVVNKDNTSHYVKNNFILLKNNRDHPLEKRIFKKR